MYMSFLDQQYKPVIPLVLDEYRAVAGADLTNLIQPPFSNQLPEEEYRLFTAGKSDLLPSIKAQFESYLEYSFDKLNNWQALRDAYQTRRLAVMIHEHSEPEFVWYCQPLEEGTMETYTPPVPQEVMQPSSIELGGVVFTTGDLTLNQAIEIVKAKAQAASQSESISRETEHLTTELAALEARKAVITARLTELQQIQLPSSEEFNAIAELVGTLTRLFN